jgi:NADH pyrophosphatase NudC (nudix superfamily)
VAYFLAITKTEKIKLQKSELENFAWLNYEDCLERLTFENSKELLKNAYKFLISDSNPSAGG